MTGSPDATAQSRRKKPSREPHRDRDVAIILDASLDGVHKVAAEKAVKGLAARVARVAIAVFGDHRGCLRGPGVSAEPQFELREMQFGQAVVAQWLEENFLSSPNEYYDAAVECALRWATCLEWRGEKKYLYVIGDSLPHEPQGEERMPGIRTGVECPAGVAWYAQLEALQRLGVKRFAAVPPLAKDRLVSRLIYEFWSKISEDGVAELDDQLCDRWSRHHPGPS